MNVEPGIPSAVFAPVVTERHVVRVLTACDVSEDYLAWFDDPVVIAHIRAATARQTLETLRTFVAEKHASPSALLLGIFARDSGQHIGNLKFEPLHAQSTATIVGVLIGAPAWRSRGVFRETFLASAAALRALFGTRACWLGVAKDNHAAIRAYRKAGFIERKAPPADLYPVLFPQVIYMSYFMAG